jgi:outer membrane protein assembly factor BamA
MERRASGCSRIKSVSKSASFAAVSPSSLAVILLCVTACLLGPPQRGSAQNAQKSFDQAPANERQLISITVVGNKRFPQDAIATTTSLQIGTPVVEDDFKKAIRLVGDTGCFTDVGYSYSFSSAGTKLELHVTEAEKFVPARFEDFVWFPEAEMRARIKEHVPLFDGQLPLSGRMTDDVSDVLQAMLVEGGIPGHVDYVRAGKDNGPVEAIVFKVSEVLIRIRKIEFTGAGADELPALEAAAERIPSREYSKSRLNLFAQRQLLPVYYERGYLKASFGDPQPKPVKTTTDDSDDGPRNQSVVDVSFPVTPGQQYKVKSLAWSGNHEFPTETLEKMIHLQSGQIADTVRLSNDLKSVQTLYTSHGFMKAAVKPEADFDDAAGTVGIRLSVAEDIAYHMGDLEFRGLDNSLTAKLRELWKIRPGEVYDATYLSEYLDAARKILPSRVDWECTPHVTANVRDKTVDVDLIYAAKAPK